jgi:hypothetical protein
MEVKINAGQAELEERVTDKLDKQLKGVTSMVEQQTRNLREGIEATRRDTEDTQRNFEAQLAAAEARTRHAGGGNGGTKADKVKPPKFNGSISSAVSHRQFEAANYRSPLDTLTGGKLFFTLDLKSGYWQVAFHPNNKEKMAFSTGQGLWNFTVMPFSLCNAPATFERLMDSILRGLAYDACLVYLEDVIVVGRTFQEQLDNLRKVFQMLREAPAEELPGIVNLLW